MSLYQCILGYQPHLYPWNVIPINIFAVDEWFTKNEQVWEQTHQHITTATERHRHQADRRRGEKPTYKQGDRGCKKDSLLNSMISFDRSTEFSTDPDYRDTCINPSFHVSLLKKFIPGTLDEHKVS